MIIDLKEKSGLGLRLDIDKPGILFEEDLKSTSPAIRTIDEMEGVLLDKDIKQPQELYYMYRDIHRFCDEAILEGHRLRYDVTVIKPSHLGEEFMKTAGHYHPGDFPELYEVVSGRCFCFLQRPNAEDYRTIEEVILVEAVAGQKIVIPPGFGHILVNPGPDYLVTSNWVSSCFQSRYELYKKAGGAAYFVIASGAELELSPQLKIRARFIKNPHFRQVPNIGFAQPTSEIRRFGLAENSPIYNIISENPKVLDFLNHPLDYDYGDVFLK
jgi:glucose-6-phosphate isomerase